MNRREFIWTAVAVPVTVMLPRHRHHYVTSINSDAYRCECGDTITGLEIANGDRSIDDIVSETLRSRSAGIVDNIQRNNTLLRKFNERR